jgi:hypothetical protein
MITCAKADIFQPNPCYALATVAPKLIPAVVCAALKEPNWVNAMDDEFAALKCNEMWTLVDRPPGAKMSHLFFQRKPSANLYACQDQVSCILFTPKIGTGKGLTCGPSLVTKYHSAGKISSEDSVKMLAVGNTPSFGKKDFLRL